MGQRPRICRAGLTYHAYSRCINEENLMKKDEVKDMMMEVLRETQEKFEYKLGSFVIMDNHFHFIIQTVNDIHSISKIMQRIKSVFAKRYNKKYNRKGPVWNERFGSVIAEQEIDPFTYIVYLLWYLAKNPVRAGMVKYPQEYKYSSINHYLIKDYENKFKVKIHLHDAFLSLGKTFYERVKRFIEYEKLCMDWAP